MTHNQTAERVYCGAKPVVDLNDGSFTACLNRHLRRSGLSLSALARGSWLDIGYVSRLVNLPCDPLNPRLNDHGDKRRPSRDTVIRLGLAMRLAMSEAHSESPLKSPRHRPPPT